MSGELEIVPRTRYDRLVRVAAWYTARSTPLSVARRYEGHPMIHGARAMAVLRASEAYRAVSRHVSMTYMGGLRLRLAEALCLPPGEVMVAHSDVYQALTRLHEQTSMIALALIPDHRCPGDSEAKRKWAIRKRYRFAMDAVAEASRILRTGLEDGG